jgi:hypothetical protein
MLDVTRSPDEWAGVRMRCRDCKGLQGDKMERCEVVDADVRDDVGS